jgi:hypothetical protein
MPISGLTAPRAEPLGPVVEPVTESNRGPLFVAVGATVLAVVVRLLFLLTPAGGLDGDEGVTGIMARRMADGDDLYVFFLGQSYQSAIEQYPQALLFALGVPVDPLTLRIPQLALAAVTCFATYLVGARMLRTRWHAALAAVLFAVGPYFLIWKGARSFAGYSTELLIVFVTYLLVLDLDLAGQGGRRWRSAAAGFCLGITYWVTPSGYYLLVPAALWLAGSIRRSRREVLGALVGAAVGLLPIAYWTVRSGTFPTPSPGTAPTTASERLSNLFDEVGREFIGVAHLNGNPGWPVTLGRLTLWLLVATAFVALARRARGILDLVTLRTAHRRPFDMILLAVPITIVAYVASKYAWFVTEPRYLFAAFPLLILGLAQLVPARPRYAVPAAAAVLLFVGGTSLTLLVSHADDVPGTADHDFEDVVAALERDGTDAVYADYWTAMPLEFVAGDRLVVGSLTTPERLPDERRAVDRARNPVWIASRGANADDISAMRTALDAAGITHRERTFGDVSVFDRFSERVRPWEIGLGVPPP